MKSLRPETDMFLIQILDIMPLGMENPLPTLLLFRFLLKTDFKKKRMLSNDLVQCFFVALSL